MAYYATVLSIFVSSPGDVSVDREKILSAISAWNQRNGERQSLFFNALTWEKMVAPDRSGSGQEVIDQQIGNAYDIYLGIMWSRFGSPTKNASSGTADEFNQALERHDAGDPVTISFLFNKSPISQDILDGVQFQKVQEFKSLIADKGCLYREYSDDMSLIESINLILDRAMHEFKSRDDNSSTNAVPDSSHELADPSSASDPPEELGVLDISEAIEEDTNRFAKLMGDWTSRLEGSGKVAENATDELRSISRFGEIEPKAMRQIVGTVASSVENVANWGDSNQDELDEIIERLSELFSDLITVSSDFSVSEEDVAVAIDGGVNLVNTIRSANESLRELAQIVLSMPRMSKEMIKANKHLASVIDRMILKNETFASNIEISTRELENKKSTEAT